MQKLRGNVWLVVGIVLVAAGCLLPQIALYVVGVPLLALGIARLAGGRLVRRVVVGVVVVLLAAAVPTVLANQVTNRDMAWRLDDARDRAWSVDGLTYVNTDDGLTVLDADGSEAWTSDDQIVAVAHDGASFDGDGMLDTEGERVWSRADLGDDSLGSLSYLAHDAGVTLLGGADDQQREPRLVAVDDTGDVLWDQTFTDDVFLANYNDRESADGTLARRVVLIDDDTTRVFAPASNLPVRTESQGEVGPTLLARPVDDRVLIISSAADESGRSTGCESRLVQDDEVLWSSSFEGCTGTYASPPFDRGWFADRVYLELNGGSTVTIDLADGTASPVDANAFYTPTAVVRASSERLTATDPTTGDELWTREVDVRPDFDVQANRRLLIKEPTRVPNPVLRPSLRTRFGVSLEDWSQRITVLDPATGDELGSVVDPLGRAADIRFRDVEDGVVVLHREYGTAYAIGF